MGVSINSKWHHSLNRYRFSQLCISILHMALMICICYVILYPLFVKVITSFMEEKDLYDSTVQFIPKHFTWENYVRAFSGLNYLTAFINSLMLSAFVGIANVISSSLVGYGFARFKFPLKKFWIVVVVIILLVPTQTIMIPLYRQFRNFTFGGLTELLGLPSFNLTSTILPIPLMSLFCVGMKSGLYVFMMMQCFRGIPKEIEEATYIDGAGTFRTFFTVVLPCTKPMIMSIFLFSFVWQWTDTYWTSFFRLGEKLTLLSGTLQNLASMMFSKFGSAGASLSTISPAFKSIYNNTGSILVLLPLVVVYLICQRYFIEGIERTGIVG